MAEDENLKLRPRSGRGRLVLFTLLSLILGLAGGVLLARYGLGKPVSTTAPGRPAGKPTAQDKILYYRSSMIPGYTSDKPGKDPMGMDLIPVYATEGQEATNTVRVDPVTIQNMGIRTAVLKKGPLIRVIRTVGRVAYNEEALTFVTAKYEGWVQKLYVNQTGQAVRKGEPMFEVYSPQLYSAQQEFLAALHGVRALAAGSTEVRGQQQQLLDAARTKLSFLDVPEPQIDELARTGTVRKTLTFNSPADGVVTEKAVTEGSYIKPDMKLYTLADLAKVWVYVDVYEYQLPWVRLGEKATMRLVYLPGKEYTGRVIYIYPYLDQRTRVIKVRLEFANSTRELKPDMFATVRLLADLHREALLIPREAFIDTGVRKVAFEYLGGGQFQPRDIQTGVEGENGLVEVLSGLRAGMAVITSGEFLIDSESNLKEAMAKMEKPPPLPQRGAPTPGKADHGMPSGEHHPMPMTMPGGAPMEMEPTSQPAPLETPQTLLSELNSLMEHYLALERLLAADSLKGTVRHARQISKSGGVIQKNLRQVSAAHRRHLTMRMQELIASAEKIKGLGLAEDRVYFVDLSTTLIDLVGVLRPDRQRWPKLYVYRCPMSKGEWLQADTNVANPFYGYQMLKCGDVIAVK